MTRGKFRPFRRVLYSLKREYGLRVDIYRNELGQTDFSTGRQAHQTFRIKVDNAVVLPSRLQKDFTYDLAFIAANKNFTTGGFFDKTQRRILISKRDLRNWVLDLEQWVVFSGKKYHIKEIFEYENNEGVMLLVTQLNNEQLNQFVDVHGCSNLQLTQDVSYNVTDNQIVKQSLNLADVASVSVVYKRSAENRILLASSSIYGQEVTASASDVLALEDLASV